MTKGGTRGKQIPPVKTEDLEHDKFNTIYESLTDDLVVLTALEKMAYSKQNDHPTWGHKIVCNVS